MSVEAFQWVIRHSTLEGLHRTVLGLIAWHHHAETGRCDPSTRTLAREAGVHTKTVMAGVRDAVAAGELVVEKGAGRRPNRYILPWWDDALRAREARTTGVNTNGLRAPEARTTDSVVRASEPRSARFEARSARPGRADIDISNSKDAREANGWRSWSDGPDGPHWREDATGRRQRFQAGSGWSDYGPPPAPDAPSVMAPPPTNGVTPPRAPPELEPARAVHACGCPDTAPVGRHLADGLTWCAECDHLAVIAETARAERDAALDAIANTPDADPETTPHD